jgi:hypothetical protein
MELKVPKATANYDPANNPASKVIFMKLYKILIVLL